jgi:hypothetical protein
MVQEMEITTENGRPIHLAYDETGDVLEIVFDDVEATCAVELTDNILLRFHRELGQATGLTILDFSVLASPSELGPRSFALTGLEHLPDDLREMVARMLRSPPRDAPTPSSDHTLLTSPLLLFCLTRPAGEVIILSVRCAMPDQSDVLTLPRAGRLQMDIHLSAEVNVTAAMARRKVNAFLATHVGNLLLADDPVLTLGERIVWRVPVDLTAPPQGRLDRVGEVDVDVESGELLLDETQIAEIQERAQRVAAGSAP